MEGSTKTVKTTIHYPLSSIFHPLLLLWLLTLPAITPLLQPTLTHSADGLLHLALPMDSGILTFRPQPYEPAATPEAG